MSKKRFVVKLTEQERAYLNTLIGKGVAPARTLAHAPILLKTNHGEAGPGWTDEAIATAAVEVSRSTVVRVRKRCVSKGLEAALERKAPDREYRRKLDGEKEARLIALACSEPPKGRKRWTLRLLAEHLVALEPQEQEQEQEGLDSVSHETVRQVFKQTPLSLT